MNAVRPLDPGSPPPQPGHAASRFVFGLLLPLALMAAGCAAPRQRQSDFEMLDLARDIINREYIDPAAATRSNLLYGALAGMVDALGDQGHSAFLTPEMVKDLRRVEDGEFKGVGLEVQMKRGRIVVVSPVDGSPADKAGVKPGDIILQVDGRDVSEWPLTRVLQQISGRPGTAVRLLLEDPRTTETRLLTLIRATIKVRDVSWERLPGLDIAHVRVASFDAGVARDLSAALAALKNQGLSQLILDLRNNSGGLLDEAVSVASQFLESGVVLVSRRLSGATEAIPVRAGGQATSIPMVVLINEGSASGAEIVAAALQDAGRAKLVGQTTFGTGTVLQEFPLPGGAALLLATEEWLTRAGRSFWHKGIKPDVTVALEADVDPLFPAGLRGLTPDQLNASGDRQLIEAIRLLGSRQQNRTAGSPR